MDTGYAIPRSRRSAPKFGFRCWIELLNHLEGPFLTSKEGALEAFCHLKLPRLGCALFFDPSGGTLYAELYGTLYEWDLQENEPGPGWWIGE